MVFAAIISAALALIVASYTLFVTSPWLRPTVRRLETELDACDRGRREARQQVQLIVGALVGLLPQNERLHLLARLDAVTDENGAESL